MTLGEAIPLLDSPRIAFDEGASSIAYVGRQLDFARREDHHFVEVVGAALVVHVERGQTIDFVAPQIDANRCISRRREHVDDRTSLCAFATMLDEIFTAIAIGDEPFHQVVGVHVSAATHDDRLARGRTRCEFLQQRAHRSDDDARLVARAQSPQHLESASHRFDARTHAFEGECLPGGEEERIRRPDVLHEIVVDHLCCSTGRRGHDERGIRPALGQSCDHEWSGDLRAGERRIDRGGRIECGVT